MGFVCFAAVVAYVASLRGTRPAFDWSLFSSTLSSLNWGWLALSAVLGLATYLGRALRWAIFLKPLRSKPNLWNLIKATVIGFTALSLLGRPGEFVRPYLIAVKEQVSLSSQIAAWFLERIFDLLIALLIFGWGLSQVRGSDARLGPALEWVFRTGGTIVWIACVVICVALLFLRQYLDVAGRRLVESLAFLPERYLTKAKVLVGTFVQGLESIRSTRAALTLVGYTILEWALIAGCYVCAVR
ncbi:MAG: lysylphosphatidylglycerol synthase transmembrane domain-containing protein [Bryobacteraceae bacterium]